MVRVSQLNNREKEFIAINILEDYFYIPFS